ncbi:toxin Cry1Ac domain D-VI-related protein [Listeria rocourtiae]|uniref:toxin Cry1Ac domain D-VI-related protein n=1 Tax=Listeria rocourtiae TaxID=647910 RepID=UPI003D2F62C7
MIRKNMKKIVSTMAIASILGTTVLTPLNVLSTKGYAIQNDVATSPYYELSNPNLMTTSIERISNDASAELKHWTIGSSHANLGTVSTLYSEIDDSVSVKVPLDSLQNSTRKLTSTGEGNLTMDNYSAYLMVVQTIATEVGKEYTISFNYTQTNSSSNNSFWLGMLTSSNTMNDVKYTAASGVAKYTFVATEDTSRVFIQLETAYKEASKLNMTNMTTGKSDNQLAKEAVDTLIGTDGKVKTNVSEAWIEDIQKQIDLVENTAQKAAVQKTLNDLLVEINENIALENERQEEAITKVKELFNNNDVTGIIKDTTDQTAIDNAQKAVDAVTDPEKKEALQKELDEAQKQLEARNEAAEKARQEVAENSIKELFNNNDVTGTIKDTTDQTAIDNAQKVVDAVTDPEKKEALQKELDEAKKQLEARNEAAEAVEKARQEVAENSIKELFNNNDVTGTIKDTTDQTAIDNAQKVVDAVTDPEKKEALQKELDEAKKQLEARNEAAEAAEKARQEVAENSIKELFNNNDVTGTIKDTTDQTAIDNAQKAVDAVTDPAVKESLQKDLDTAKALLEIGKITNIEVYIAGTGYVKGTTSPGVTRVGLFVNGVLVKTAAASNGAFQIYAGGTPEMKVAGQIFEIAAITSTSVAGIKTASTVSPKFTPKLVAPTINEFYKGEGYITGTVPTGAVKVALYIDGIFIRYGVITGNDFKIYGSDVADLKIRGKEFHVLVEDATGQKSDLTASTVKLKDTTAEPDDVTTKSSYFTGTIISDNAKRIALYVNGEFVRYGAISDGGYRVYMYDVAALKQAGAEYELQVLDSGNNVLTSIKGTVK